MPQEEEDGALTPGMTAEAAFARIAAALAAEIDVRLVEVFGSDAPSGPHKARVALRRLTTALDAFRPILNRRAAQDFRREAKAIFRKLGELRDSDVRLEVAVPDERAVAGNRVLREKVRKMLRVQKAVAFAPRLMRVMAEMQLMRESSNGLARCHAPVEVVVAAALQAAWQATTRHGKDVARMGGRRRHELRKDLKTLRYLSEFALPLWPDADSSAFMSALTRLQDDLGLLNDLRLSGAPKAADTSRVSSTLAAAESDYRALVTAGSWWPV